MNNYIENPNTHNRLVAGSNPAEPTSEASILTQVFYSETSILGVNNRR